jgi:hypothetical protein
MVAKACVAQNELGTKTQKPCLTGEVGELGDVGPLVAGRLCLILMLLKAWDRLLQEVCGGLDDLVWSNIVHRVRGLL